MHGGNELDEPDDEPAQRGVEHPDEVPRAEHGGGGGVLHAVQVLAARGALRKVVALRERDRLRLLVNAVVVQDRRPVRETPSASPTPEAAVVAAAAVVRAAVVVDDDDPAVAAAVAPGVNPGAQQPLEAVEEGEADEAHDDALDDGEQQARGPEALLEREGLAEDLEEVQHLGVRDLDAAVHVHLAGVGPRQGLPSSSTSSSSSSWSRSTRSSSRRCAAL